MVTLRSVIIVAAGTALGVATPAAAQYRDQPAPVGVGGATYRDGQPMVMTPPPPPPDASIGATQRFRSAYARANRPRIVIFWNREFTDEVGSKYENYTTLHSRTDTAVQGSSAAVQGWGWSAAAGQASGSSETNAEVRSGTDRVNDGRREAQYDEAVDFDIESAFTNTMQGAGATLVDRTSIMRTTGLAKGAGATSNVQGVETSAILGKADIVLEVVQLADSRKSTGVTYRVIARNVRTGRVLATLSTAAKPPVGKMPYVAGASGGFVRAVAPEPGPQDIGRQLAIETMSALSARM